MAGPNKPITHTAWGKHFRGRHFRKWVELGDARVEVDNNGATIVHVFGDRTVRGDTGYICVMPLGMKPSDPPPQAKRPQSDEEDEEDF